MSEHVKEVVLGRWIRQVWVLYTAILVAIIFSLIIPLPIFNLSRIQEAIWYFLHFPAWMIVAWICAQKQGASDRGTTRGFHQVLSSMGRLAQRDRCLVGLFFAVPLLEGVQYWTGRTPDINDIYAGWWGVAAGIALRRISNPGLKARSKMTAFGVIALGFFFTGMPVGDALVDRHRMLREFPVLFSGNHQTEVGRWYAYGVDFNNKRTLRGASATPGICIQIGNRVEYPGLFMREMKHNWEGMQRLFVMLEVKGEHPIDGWIRIKDHLHAPYGDRFQWPVELISGLQIVSLEWGDRLVTEDGRLMNMSQIKEWGIFFDRACPDRQIRMVRAWLEQGRQ